jgi:hypothetical protein
MGVRNTQQIQQILLGMGAGGLSDGNPVSLWLDSSGNGHNAAQSGSARPVFKKNVLNGKPVVRFTTAGLSGLNLVTQISGASPWTMFAVMKATGPTTTCFSLAADQGNPMGPLENSDGLVYAFWREGGYSTLGGGYTTAFHIFTAESQSGQIWIDGTSTAINSVAVSGTGNWVNIGYQAFAPLYSNGDIAEIILYSGALALLKKLLLVPILITPGGPLTPPAKEEDLVPEPFAAGDRANIEKYLGTKYGITVTSGGTAVDPSTVAGLQAWWKADTLG